MEVTQERNKLRAYFACPKRPTHRHHEGQPGSSGGPIMDASGRVTGIAMSRLDAVAGKVTQNVNFAISASIAMNFLTIKDVTPKTSGTAAAERKSWPKQPRNSPCRCPANNLVQVSL